MASVARRAVLTLRGSSADGDTDGHALTRVDMLRDGAPLKPSLEERIDVGGDLLRLLQQAVRRVRVGHG